MTEIPIIIEDKVGMSEHHLAKTVVRSGKNGFIISTIRSTPELEIPHYETQLWKFDGYEIKNGQRVPIINKAAGVDGTDLDTENQFPGEPQEAIRYHYSVVETLAQALEETTQ